MIPANPYRFARNCFNSSHCEANGHTVHDSAFVIENVCKQPYSLETPS
jgi:hypothetical protein